MRRVRLCRIRAIRELTYCVVNTNGRDISLNASTRFAAPIRWSSSTRCWCSTTPPTDGSVEAVEAWIAGAGAFGASVRLIARDRRAGKAENDSLLLREARGRFCLLLNEDTELEHGAAAALLAALGENPGAAAAGARS